MQSENSLYIIVISVVITVNYCKCMLLLYSPLNSYLYVHWTLNKYYYYYLSEKRDATMIVKESPNVTIYYVTHCVSNIGVLS